MKIKSIQFMSIKNIKNDFSTEEFDRIDVRLTTTKIHINSDKLNYLIQQHYISVHT